MVKNLDEETGEQYKTVIIGGKKVKVPILFILPEEHGEKEIETYEHPEVNVGKAADSKEEPLDKLTDGKLEEVEKEPQPSQQNIRDEGQAILDQKVPDTKIGAPPKRSQISLDTAIANKINALAIQVKVNRLVEKKDEWDDKESDEDKKYIKGDKLEESGLYDELSNEEGLKNIDDESLHYEPATGDHKGKKIQIDAEVDNQSDRKVNVTPSRVVGTNPSKKNPHSALANDARYSDGSEAQNVSQRNADKWKSWLANKKDYKTEDDFTHNNQQMVRELSGDDPNSKSIRDESGYEYDHDDFTGDRRIPPSRVIGSGEKDGGAGASRGTSYSELSENEMGKRGLLQGKKNPSKDDAMAYGVRNITQENAEKWKAWLANKKEEQTTFDDEENVDPLHAEAKKKKKEVWDKARRDGIGMTWDSQGEKQ